MKKTVTLLLTMILLLALCACSNDSTNNSTDNADSTDYEFTIYNYSTSIIYLVRLTPPGGNKDGSDDIILYDDFENPIPAENTDSPYTAIVNIPDIEMSGTWQIKVSNNKTVIEDGETSSYGGSGWLDFKLSDGINGFSMHDIDDQNSVAVMAHVGSPDAEEEVVEYTPSEGESNWNGIYINDGLYLRVYNFNGSEFEFEFYVPSSDGTRVVSFGDTAVVTDDDPSRAIFDTITFDYTIGSGMFIMDNGDHKIASGLYVPEGGFE